MGGHNLIRPDTPQSRNRRFITHHNPTTAILTAILLITTPTHTHATDITGIGHLMTDPLNGTPSSDAFDVSSDGSVVVGDSSFDFEFDSGTQAFRWLNGEITGLGDLDSLDTLSFAKGVSADGSVVVGNGDSFNGTEAFRWEAGVMSPLNDIPGGVGFRSEANDVSANGNIVVGQGRSASGPEAFRLDYSDHTTLQAADGLGDLDGGAFDSRATGVSANGAVVVGVGTSASGPEAFRWEGGVMSGLGDLDGGAFQSQANAVSADGSVVVGWGTTASGIEAFRWEDGTINGLGSLSEDDDSVAHAVSADGSVIVGESLGEAFIWDPTNGMRNLKQALTTEFELDLTDWFLFSANGISPDGQYIVGEGHRGGNREGWRVFLGGVTKQWTAAAGTWDNHENWDPMHAPTHGDDVIIRPTIIGGADILGPSTPRTVQSLTIGKTGFGRSNNLLIQAGAPITAINGITIEDRGRLASRTDIHSPITILPGGELANSLNSSINVDAQVEPNQGTINIIGGAINFTRRMVNSPGAKINVVDGTLTINTQPAFFQDLTQWLDLVSSPEALITDPNGVALADEVSSPPTLNQKLTNQLTFDAANTGLQRSFQIRTLQAFADFTFDDCQNFFGGCFDEPAPLPGFDDALSIGDILSTSTQDDDWELTVTDGPNLYAFGFELRSNDTNSTGVIIPIAERINIFDPAGTPIGFSINIPTTLNDGSVFIGVISPNPIARIEFDEDTGPDDIAIADFRFATLTSWGLTNEVGAELNAINATLNFPGDATPNGIGLLNLGTLNLTNTTINGDVHSPTGSTINVASDVTFNGLVSGAATFPGAGLVTFNGGYSPGDSPADVNFPGSVSFGPANTLTIEASNPATPTPTPGIDHDRLNITANVTLDGTLHIAPIPDPDTIDDTPLDTQFPILTYATRSGFFQTITGTLINTAFALAPLLDETTNEFILRATIPGDLNLDNKVSVADLSTFALNFNTTPGLYDEATNTNSWQLGDFNTDGQITVADLSLLALNFGFELLPDGTSTTPTPLTFAAAARLIGLHPATLPAASVPEPATALPLTLLPALFRRRHQPKTTTTLRFTTTPSRRPLRPPPARNRHHHAF